MEAGPRFQPDAGACRRIPGTRFPPMSAIPLDQLAEYSRLAVPLILARFPEWEGSAKLLEECGPGEFAVEFRIPCPSSEAKSGLWVSTDGGELSVGFDHHHTHFMAYDGDHRRQIECGLEYASDFIEERAGVVSWHMDGRIGGSCSVELPHPDPLPRLNERFGLFMPGQRDCNLVKLRSWTGRFDREEK